MKKKIALITTILAVTISTGCIPNTIFAETDNTVAYTYSVENAEVITLNGSTASSSSKGVSINGSTVTIKSAGTYKVSGTLTNGQILVDTDKTANVTIILDNANITNSSSAPIYSKQAKNTAVYLSANSKNTLTNKTTTDVDADAALFVQDNLIIGGTGSLTVNGNAYDGITCKDDLIIESGTIAVNSEKDGIKGKDSVTINGGSITITATEDGIKSNNDSDTEKGYIVINAGDINITAQQDAIQAETDLTVNGGTFDLNAGGGNEKSTKTHNDFGGGFGGNRGNRAMVGENTEDTTNADGTFNRGGMMTPPDMQNGERPEMPTGVNGERPELPYGEMPNGNRLDNFQPQTNNNGENTEDTTGNIPSQSMGEKPSTDTDDESTVSTKGLKAGGNIKIAGGTIKADCADDTIHAGGEVAISNGNMTLLSGDDGIHSDTTLTISGGTIDIQKAYEGLEGTNITVSGGNTKLVATDDGINVNDSNGVLTISNGYLYVNANGDGLDSNGSVSVTGGTVVVDGPTSGGDGALDYDKTATITGGTLIASGSSGMAQTITATDNKSTIAVYFTETQKADTLVSLTDESGNLIMAIKPTKTFQHIVLASDKIEQGKTYTLSTGGTMSTEAVNGVYTSGTVKGATKLCTVKPTETTTNISQDGTAASGRGTSMGGGMRGQKPSNFGGVKATEATTTSNN